MYVALIIFCYREPTTIIPHFPPPQLEVGSYLGYTTRTLAGIFKKVIAFDYNSHYLEANGEILNKDLGNVFMIKGELPGYNFRQLQHNNVEVVFLDASHDFESVMRDIDQITTGVDQEGKSARACLSREMSSRCCQRNQKMLATPCEIPFCKLLG